MSASPPGSPRGAASAFEELFRQNYARLCEFVHGYVRSPEVAEDLVQDLFLTLWGKHGAEGTDEPTPAYLFAAARNRALKHLRHQRVVERFRDHVGGETEVADGDTDHEVRHQETEKAIEAAIAELPDRCREIFLLSRRQHMTYAEIAGALDISVKTVEVQMWRALRKLRVSLADHLSIAALALASGLRWFPPVG